MQLLQCRSACGGAENAEAQSSPTLSGNRIAVIKFAAASFKIPLQKYNAGGRTASERISNEPSPHGETARYGAGGRTRTGTTQASEDFKSAVSTIPPHRLIFAFID